MIEHANHFNVGIDARDDVAPAVTANLVRSLFYSVGCHAGLNVPDTDTPGSRPLDLPQAFAQQGAVYFSNTGYGLGIPGDIGLTERLLLLLSEKLTEGGSTTIGKAVAAAKQDYWARFAYRSGYYASDEKILVQSVLYGLPMTEYSGSGPSVQAEPVGVLSSPGLRVKTHTTAASTGLTKQRTTYFDYTLSRNDTESGSYYYHLDPTEGALHSPGLPAQPKIFTQYHIRGTSVHGAVFHGGRYTDQHNFAAYIPQLSIPALNLPRHERFRSMRYTNTYWYPSVPHMFAGAQTYSPETLVIALGQYHLGVNTERVYDEITFNIYYSTSDDNTPPTINFVGAVVQQAMAKFTVQAADLASGIEEVWITHTDGYGAWTSISLKQEQDGSWTGRLPVALGVDYIVQVVDKAGNVTIDDNAGRYYLVNGGTGASGYRVYLPMNIRGG